jgi:hypothetical protein
MQGDHHHIVAFVHPSMSALLPRALLPNVSHPIFSSFHVVPYRWFIFHEFLFYFQN